MIFSSPPQFAEVLQVYLKAKLQRRLTCTQVMSQLKTRLSSLAQLSRAGPRCAQFASHSAGGAACAPSSGPCGTTIAAGLAEVVADGASTPWKRIRCSRGLGTSAASRCMNSSGGVPWWVVSSRQGVLSFSTTCPGRSANSLLRSLSL